MASSSALHRAHTVRRLLAHLAVVLLITLAAVAGLTAPSSADDEGAGTGAGTGADGTAAVDATAGETAADTPTEAPAEEPKQAEPKQAEPEQAAPAQDQPEQTEPEQTEPEQPATTPRKSAPTARTTTAQEAPETVATTSSKVWICKYSRTPSDNEKAQTVNSVDYNENREPGTWGFEDAQGSTYVYSFDTGAASKPTKDDCPILIVTPAAPTWGEPTCASPLGTYVLATYPSTRAAVATSGSLAPGGTFTVTYTAIPPYRFLVTGATPVPTVTFSHTFTTPKNCPVVINDLPTVTTADPCGTANDTVTLSTSPKYTGVDNGDGTATFTAVAPNVFPGNASTHTVHYTENTDVPCVTVIHPAAPVAEPSTSCDVPWSLSVTDTDHVGYATSPASSGTEATTVTITATPDATYAFGPTSGWTVNPDGTATYQHTFAAAESCLEVPAAPAPTAPTCFDDGSLTVTVPAHTAVKVNGAQITDTTVYGPGSYDVVYTADDGHVFSASFVEMSSKSYDDITVLPQTGTCVIDVPAPPVSLDACNPAGTTTNVAWDTFPTLANIEWSVDQATGDAVATAINGMAFAGGATEQRYPLPSDNGIICTAPVDPDVQQSAGCDVQGTLTVPATEGVVYALDGTTIAAGTHTGPLTGTLTATVATGYENTDADWEFEVDISAALGCLQVPLSPTPVPATCFDDGSLTVTVPAHTNVTVDGQPITDTTAYGPGTHEVTYSAEAGHVFSDGVSETTALTYSDLTVAAATGECVIDVPAPPVSLDACNPAGTTTNVAWDTFPTLANIEWSVDQATGDAVATAINGMAFAGGATEQRYPLPSDNGIICTAPVDPAITQSTGCEVEGTLTVPATEGVVYALDGTTIAPGTYAGPLSGTLTAKVLAGYENTDAYWTFEFDIPAAPSCLEVPAQPAELDACNPGTVTNNVEWDTFPTLENVEWSVDEVTGEAVATAINGAAFGPGVTEVRFQPSADSGEECTLEPGTIESTCVDAVPHLSYALTLEDGYVGPTDVTITFVNPDGKDYVVTGQPLSGKLLWPGASVDPAGWPGWVRNPDGSYTETTGNYAWTRDGVKVTFEVNPHYELVVAYPQATTACANPQQPETGPETDGPKTDGPHTDGPRTHAAPKTHDGVLPNTGAPSGSGLYGLIGGLSVVLGAWLMMRERRRRA